MLESARVIKIDFRFMYRFTSIWPHLSCRDSAVLKPKINLAQTFPAKAQSMYIMSMVWALFWVWSLHICTYWKINMAYPTKPLISNVDWSGHCNSRPVFNILLVRYSVFRSLKAIVLFYILSIKQTLQVYWFPFNLYMILSQ